MNAIRTQSSSSTSGLHQAAVLVLPPYRTEPADLLTQAALQRGMEVEVLEGKQVPEGLRGRRAYLYAARLFGDLVGTDLGLGLLEPPGEWLTRLPAEVVGRDVQAVTLAQAWELRRPLFVKPFDGKSFKPQVYPNGTYLPGSDAMDPDIRVLVAEQLQPLNEFRLFVLDGAVHTASHYATNGRVDVHPVDGHPLAGPMWEFAEKVLELSRRTLPSAVVIDVGLVLSPGETNPKWVAIEANAAWSSGCYAADPQKVLDTVIRSAGPRDEVSTGDLRYLRTR